MAKGYRPVNRDQQFLMPECMADWLPMSDPVWLVISAVAGLDTSGLHAMRRTGAAGRAGYDPDMLLTLLIWAWAQGVRSSRVIERLCQRDVAYRIICAGDAPDHVTVSRFRGQAAQVCEDLFGSVLGLCARLGMAQLGVVAIDSVKIASDASLAANRTEDGLVKAAAEQADIDAAKARQLAAAAAAEHAATDAAEDELYGPGVRGDELPEDLVDPGSRARRIAEALEQLKADTAAGGADREAVVQRKRQREADRAAKRQTLLADYQDRRARGLRAGPPPVEIRVEVLTESLAQEKARVQARNDAWAARPFRGGHTPGRVEDNVFVKRRQAALDRAIAERVAAEQAAAATAEAQAAQGDAPAAGSPKRNITDPQSRMMRLRGGGWVQGYNCQAATSSDGLIIATSVGNNPNDATAFATIMDKTAAAAALIDNHRASSAETATGIGIVLADAGYLSTDNLTMPGPDRLIAVGKSRDLALAAHQDPATGSPPPDATPIEAMAHRLRTPEGHDTYKQRSHIAETPFAHAKHNLGFRRFTSRGIDRAAAEFNFHALVHNLIKAITAGALTPAYS
ncbi:transposase [Mycobacterium haemophilum]|uniref:Transposase n=2 Tax=Mycobacterium haemophilum TaxID=29311 RepID=A0A0I9UGM8_9MYCO|nr:transposase [Mycobacterium haemophilum]KLO33872.1 transposase [Mycobacterium haemophilum]KLO34851.1 transposase [Mycobacterium haemophilum]KLO41954.1 transposase [Mycobacterium haemophilum]